MKVIIAKNNDLNINYFHKQNRCKICKIFLHDIFERTNFDEIFSIEHNQHRKSIANQKVSNKRLVFKIN